MTSELVAAWLLTLALHVGALLTCAWLVDRGALGARPAWRELLWRCALFGGILTAGLQSAMNVSLAPRFAVPTAAAASSSARPADESQLPAMPSTSTSISRKDVSSSPPSASTDHRDAAARSTFAGAAAATATTRDLSRAFVLPDWRQLLIAAWLAGALIALARVAAAWLRVHRAVRVATPIEDTALQVEADALAAIARIPSPTLAALDDLASPIAVRGRHILVPRWALELLDRAQLRAMLAHETAHLARRDPAWKLGVAVWSALLWFLPLTAVARRRLDEVAELACDAWAARHLGDGRSLAECLAECVEHREGGFSSSLAAAMAQRNSPLLQRIDHLLGELPMNTHVPQLRGAIAVLLCLSLATLALPGFAASTAVDAPPPMPAPPAMPAPPGIPAMPPPPAPPAPPKPPASDNHVHVSSSDFSVLGFKRESTTVEVDRAGHSWTMNLHGRMTFNDRDDDVATLSEGGTASFGEKDAGVSRRIDYAMKDGALTRRYFVDDREHAIDAEASKWVAGMMLALTRESAIDVEARVHRIYARGGADAVLAEIEAIESGYARNAYLKELLKAGKLDDAQVTRALAIVDGMDSGYERRQALSAILASAPLDVSQQKLVLAQAKKLYSDYELAELLIGMLPKLSKDADVRKAWLDATAALGGAYEHRRVLAALMASQSLDDASLGAIIAAAAGIDSDYERRELLVEAIGSAGNVEPLARSYIAGVDGLGSDYEKRESLLALIRGKGFGATSAAAVLDSTAAIGSDYECREVLVALARSMPNDPALIGRYRDAARRLSDSERGPAERALDRFAG